MTGIAPESDLTTRDNFCTSLLKQVTRFSITNPGTKRLPPFDFEGSQVGPFKIHPVGYQRVIRNSKETQWWEVINVWVGPRSTVAFLNHGPWINNLHGPEYATMIYALPNSNLTMLDKQYWEIISKKIK